MTVEISMFNVQSKERGLTPLVDNISDTRQLNAAGSNHEDPACELFFKSRHMELTNDETAALLNAYQRTSGTSNKTKLHTKKF